MVIEAIKQIPPQERTAMVDKIQQTIPLERIRVQTTQGKPTEMWGFVWLKGLPFCFRAWSSFDSRLGFLGNGREFNTDWGFVHMPYHPSSFQHPIFTTSITEDDMIYVLAGLRVDNEKIAKHRQNGAIFGLFTAVLKGKEETYQDFYQHYDQNTMLRMAYVTAVSRACDEKQTLTLHIPCVK